ncbi:MAG: iron chaperone [Bacteroidota bacterium]
MKSTAPTNIDEYIAGFPKDIQKKLKEIRATIRKAAPQAEETIKYAMPTFTLNGNLVHFAVYKKHIGFYPVPRSVEAFKKQLSAYEGNKSTARFPLDEQTPLALIAKIVKFRAKKNIEQAQLTKKK